MSALQEQLLQLKQQEKQEMIQKGGERLMEYFHLQHDRPQDNDIVFWRNFVAEFFTSNAKKRWCFSNYKKMNHTIGLPPKNGHKWRCGACKRQPRRGFEANVTVLPRLFKIKYESGLLEERLHIEDPQGLQHSSGLFVIQYTKATQTSVFNEFHIVREGHLRVLFSPELKIYLLLFCAQRHDEFIVRSSLMPKIIRLWDSAQKHLTCVKNQNRSTNIELQNTSNEFVASAKKVAKSLGTPSTNELGITHMYTRCLKMAEVVCSMKDLIDYSIETGSGPMESLAKFPKITSTVVEQQQQFQQEQTQPHVIFQNPPSIFYQQQQTRR